MADVELVIKIPEEDYKTIKNRSVVGDLTIPYVFDAIRNGKRLPKGHGRLIDEKEINNAVNDVFCSYDRYSPKTFLNVIHNQCIEVIEADKESEE